MNEAATNDTTPRISDDEQPSECDPLLDITGLVDDDFSGVPEQHDAYLAEMIAEEKTGPSSPYTGEDEDLVTEQRAEYGDGTREGQP